jgi:hypothetical protein
MERTSPRRQQMLLLVVLSATDMYMEEPFSTCDQRLGCSALKESVSVWELPFSLANLRSQTGGQPGRGIFIIRGQNCSLFQWLFYNIRQIPNRPAAVFSGYNGGAIFFKHQATANGTDLHRE